MKNAKFHSQDVKKTCENKLGISFKAAKEINGWFKFGDKKIKRVTIPKGKKSIPPKTYKSMATQLGLNVHQFDELLECPLNRKGYIKIVIEP
jgi:hypothetical protein